MIVLPMIVVMMRMVGSKSIGWWGGIRGIQVIAMKLENRKNCNLDNLGIIIMIQM